MDVSSESAQLRKMARAHAAGDLDLEDYRSIRTAMIDACLGVETVASPAAPSRPSAAEAAAVADAHDGDLMAGESPWTLLTVMGTGAFALFLVTVLYILR